MWSWENSQTNTLRDILQTSLESSQMAINPPWVCVPRGRRVGWSWDTRETRSSWASVACPLQSSAHLWPEHNRLPSKPTAGSPPKRPRQNQAATLLPETWWKLHSCFPFLSLSCWPHSVMTSFLGSLLHRNSPLWVCFWGISPKWGHPNLTDFAVCPQELLRPYSKFDTLATLLGTDLL